MKNVNMQLGQCVAYLRFYYDGMTQQTLAEKAGLSRGLIGQVETGKAKPSWDTLVQLSKAFNIPLSSIIRIAELLDEGNMPDSPLIQQILRVKE